MPKLPKHCFLIGMMASGKSYWAARLAAELGVCALDLDREIERMTGRAVASIFEEQGEAEFRELERRALHGLAHAPEPLLVSTGGGTPCFFDNMAWMRRHGLTIYLETPPAVLLKRLENAGGERPLLRAHTAESLPFYLEELLARRAPFYRQAEITVDGSLPEEEVAAILKKLVLG